MKYEIEGVISKLNFNDLLKEDDDKEDYNEKCLITNLPLTKYFVKLDCGHCFNYEAIFNDLNNFKKSFDQNLNQ